MQCQYLFSRVYLFSFLFTGLGLLKAQNIEVLFTGIRSNKGQIVLKVYPNDKSYEDDQAFRTMHFKKDELAGGEITAKFNLEPGIYGFALLDDENNNKKMNYGFFGMPEEGFGFSNYYLTGLFKPKFEAFKFELRKNQHLKIIMKVKYL